MARDEPYIDVPPAERRAARLANWGLALALTPLLAFGGCMATLTDSAAPGLDWALGFWGLSCFLAIVGGVLGLRSRRLKKLSRGRAAAILGFSMPLLTALGGFLAATAMLPFQRGRAFRRKGEARLPEHAANDGWSERALPPIDLDEGVRSEVAAGWRAMAATETASIASFASLTHQLLAVGAPSALIEAAHRDGLDEVAHARLCYDVARAMDGRPLGAAPFPAATLPLDGPVTYQSLAEECLRESCVLEAASAYAARALAEHPGQHRALVEPLRAIAGDEARHAEHGWLMFEWLAARCRRPGAFAGVLERLREAIPAAVVDHDDHERLGLAGPRLWRQSVARALDEAEARLARRRAAA